MNATMIVNPRAGRCKAPAIAEAARAELSRGGWDVVVVTTDAPGHGVELAHRAATDGADVVLACGGDGTLSEVVSGLFDTDVPASLIPAGTGNDFSRTLGLGLSPEGVAKQLLTGSEQHVDMMEIAGGRFHSLNVIGLGFDAGVAVRINRRRRFAGGKTAYLTAVAQELFANQPVEARVEVDGEVWEGKALLVAIANAKSYGAGLMIAPLADIRDGELDVVIIEAVGKLAFVRSFSLMLKGTLHTDPRVRTIRGKQVLVETSEPTPVLVDGDIQLDTPLAVRILPQRARLWLPQTDGATD
ncbi:MAG TPA: diacylglycerol kinase family protein [Armatimonadota bacterium]|jgi:YegS/Rv2252/BmrU family lipid kinase|nr:diacylglycerol kinase family protein [Armatimonadota bacterium]